MFDKVYLVEKNTELFALNRQNVLIDKHEISRELDFYQWIDSNSTSNQKFFMKLFDYLFYKCDFVHEPVHQHPDPE